MTALVDLPAVREAVVWKKDAPAARLIRTGAGVAFEYLDGYDGPAVATTLPMGTAVTPGGGGALPPFFSGLLPEGRRLTAIRTAIKTSADDELSLLLAIGEDTIGDVRVRPAGTPEPTAPPRPSLEWGKVVLRELFEQAVGADPERVGLPGMQDKVSGRMIAWPARTPRGPVIIKLRPPEFPHLVENEAFFLGAARRAGLDVPEFEVVEDAAGEKGLVVGRFDRRVEGDTYTRLGQEDACQVLGRYPADKYAVDLVEVIEGLSAVTSAPAVARFRLFQQVVFGYLIGNGDQHAKNVAVLETAGEWRVSPMYDVVSSHPYGDFTLALPVMGERGISDLPRRTWLELADRVGLARPAAERIIDGLTAAASAWIADCDQLPFDTWRSYKLGRFIAHRAALLAP